MADHARDGFGAAARRKPLQAGKLAVICLSLLLGVAGFFRLIDARGLVEQPMLGDGQFLSLLLLPLVSLGLVGLVFLETVVAGYRALRSERSVTDQLSERTGYLVLRGGEAAVALLGVVIVATALPPLFAESTPAPAGVGIMLLLAAVGLGILVMSFVRSAAEIFVYG